jgi:hypothetical protein
VRIRTVKKLYKYEVTHKVPSYQWVVEYCCDHCCNSTDSEAAPSDNPPSPPVPPPGITSIDKQAEQNSSKTSDQLAAVTLRRLEICK